MNIGDIVSLVGRSRRMMVVDHADAADWIVCAWLAGGEPIECLFHRSGLIVRRLA